MIKEFNLFFLTLFKIGKIKYAPGTIASLITCLLFLLLINFFNILWKNTLNEGEGILSNGYGKKIKTKIYFSNKDREAFKIIELEVGAKWDEIQIKFKKLVKKYHPDMNAGNKKFEEKLKIVTLAYTQLKLAYKGKN